MDRLKMPISGVWRVPKTLANGATRYYYYTHRKPGRTLFWQSDQPVDGKRLPSKFVQAYQDAIATEGTGVRPGSLLQAYHDYQKESERFKRMSLRGSKARIRYLEKWLKMPMANGQPASAAPLIVFDGRKIIARMVRYRNQVWGHSPSSAEEAQTALSAFLSWCVRSGRLDFNRLSGVGSPYERRERQRLWSPEEQILVAQSAPQHLSLLFRIGLFTGLRLGDLVRLPESSVRDSHILIPTGKSRGQNTAIIPLIPEWQSLIDEALELKREFSSATTTILVNSRGRPWTASGAATSFDRLRSRIGLGPDQSGPTIHDFRKTAATQVLIMQKRYPGAITDQVIIDWFGWTTGTLEKMKRIYVSDAAVIDAITSQN